MSLFSLFWVAARVKYHRMQQDKHIKEMCEFEIKTCLPSPPYSCQSSPWVSVRLQVEMVFKSPSRLKSPNRLNGKLPNRISVQQSFGSCLPEEHHASRRSTSTHTPPQPKKPSSCAEKSFPPPCQKELCSSGPWIGQGLVKQREATSAIGAKGDPWGCRNIAGVARQVQQAMLSGPSPSLLEPFLLLNARSYFLKLELVLHTASSVRVWGNQTVGKKNITALCRIPTISHLQCLTKLLIKEGEEPCTQLRVSGRKGSPCDHKMVGRSEGKRAPSINPRQDHSLVGRVTHTGPLVGSSTLYVCPPSKKKPPKKHHTCGLHTGSKCLCCSQTGSA